MFPCRYNCGHVAFMTIWGRTNHQENDCPNRPFAGSDEPLDDQRVKGKYDLMAEEAVSVDYPGSIFGIPLAELLKEGLFLETMRTILRQHDEEPQVWLALYVQQDPVAAE